MVIAIDGPAGVGKSTIARCLARRTGFKYLVSGDLYRAITYGILVRGIDPADENLVIESIGTFDISTTVTQKDIVRGPFSEIYDLLR